MRPSSSSTALPLLRRWRAWQTQLQHHHHHQPQVLPLRPFAAAAASRTATHADVVESVAAALSRLGLNPGLGAEVCDGLLTVDLALQVGANKRLVALDITPRPPDVLAAQRNDPEPAATGRPRPSAPDTPQRAWALAQARRQALKAHGWRYVQLPAVEWLGAMGDHEEEDAMLRVRVLAAAEDDEGGGHVCGSGCSH
jgi:hypothetical protein